MAKIADAFSVIRNGANIKQGLDDSGYPITRIETISNRTVDRNKMGYAGVTDILKYADYVLQDGDILMSHINSETHLGKVALYEKQEDETIIHGMNLLCLRPKQELLNSRFAFYYLLSEAFLRQIPRITKKSVNQASFNVAALKELSIPIPTIEKQIEVVRGLDKVSKLIGLRKEQLTKLDQLVKSRFIELFGDQEVNPFGWEQSTIGECCTLKSGTSLSADVENEGGPIPYVKVGDMNYPGNERYITTSSRYVSEETAGKGLFGVGSIIFPKRGGAIGTNKKRMTKLPICADLNVMGVSSNGKLLPEYLLAYFDLIDLGALSDGSSVPQINNKNIAPLVICIPPMELQNQFAAFLEQTDKSKLAIQQSLDKLELLKKSLMQEYFG